MPENRGHVKIFYGWWMVATSFFMSLYTAGAVYFGFTAVFEPIAQEFNWSYAQVSLAASLRGLEVGLLSPVVGFLIDRFGLRKVLYVGVAIGGAGLILLKYINSLGMYYFAFILVSIGLSACGATLLMTAVVNWFRRRLTLAMAIVATGFAVGGLLVPIVSVMVDRLGWRDTMFWLGIGMFVIVIPLSTLMHHKPEQYGMLPDGDALPKADKTIPKIEFTEEDFTPGQALKTWGFWAISLAALLQALVQNAVMVHIMPYLATVGFSRTISSFVASAIPLTSVVGRLGIGFVGDRFDKKWTLVAGFGLVSLGTLSLSYVDSGAWLVVLFFILFGIGWGSTVTVRSLLVRDYFGKSRYGSIFGIYMGVLCIGAIIGPPISGWAYDTYGSYKETWLIYVALTVISAIIMATAYKARKSKSKLPVVAV